MAAKGSIAKQVVVEKLQKAFGNDFIGEYNGKYYIWVEENGQMIQIAVALTCPKTLVEPSGSTVAVEPPKSAFSGGIDFESLGGTSEPTAFKPAEITEQEKETVRDLMARLGL